MACLCFMRASLRLDNSYGNCDLFEKNDCCLIFLVWKCVMLDEDLLRGADFPLANFVRHCKCGAQRAARQALQLQERTACRTRVQRQRPRGPSWGPHGE